MAVARKDRVRFKEIWDSPSVRQYVKSKSVLHETLEYLERKGIVKIERISRKRTMVTLLTKLPQLTSKEVDRILFEESKLGDKTKVVVAGIEGKKILPDEASILIRVMFIKSEQERLYSLMVLLPVLSDPVLWPFLWEDLILALIVCPAIRQLEILRACQDNYPQDTKEAVPSLDQSLTRVLSSQQLQDYHRILDFLTTSGN